MTGTKKPPLWILIDATNAIHRDAHGCGVANAAATLGRRIDMMEKKWKPSAIVAAFDAGGPTFRHRLHPEYKAGRKRLDGIDDAIADAVAECDRRNIATLVSPDFEADDILATVTAAARADGCQVMLYSADKDLHQLLATDEVTQLVEAKKNGETLDCRFVTAGGLMEKYQVHPSQWVDWKVLVGDASDNIAGVKWIGPGAARDILKACGSLDEFYRRPFATQLSSRKRAAMLNAKSRIPLARQLCTLRTDATLPELWKEGI